MSISTRGNALTKPLKILAVTAALGMTGCVGTGTSDSGLCAGLRGSVNALEAGLLAHPETPDAVGEAGTDVVIGYNAGCAS